MPVSISGTNGVTFPDSSLQTAAASPYVLKNRIINGDMRIDQRNAGASVVPDDTGIYTLDRWRAWEDTDGAATVQQSSVVPTGFTKSFLYTTTSNDSSLAAGQYTCVGQFIEGFNTADLAWGTANAKTVTLSFWVRSSLTGTFGGSFANDAANRSYPFTYTISTANTFEYKTVTIPGDTSGTWLTTNGTGIKLYFGLGVGSNFSGTAGAWASALYLSATGATSVIGTNGATFYITGVQLEQNTSATPFERRLYNQELANCQRYFQKSWTQDVAVGSALTINSVNVAQQSWSSANTSSIAGQVFLLPVNMRTSATPVLYDIALNTGKVTSLNASADGTNNVTPNLVITNDSKFYVRMFSNGAFGIAFAYTMSAEL
jgi:hypothetical protein